ncbi:MAG: hypothetical protein AB8G86_23890 [Saprospiraceae bacterium]
MKAKMLFTFTLCLSFLFANTLEAAAILHDPVGTYEFEVTDIPDQADVTGTMVVSRTDGKLKVVFDSSAGEIELADAKLEGHKLTGKIDVQGIVLKLSGKFSGNNFEGQWNSEFGALPITATKK